MAAQIPDALCRPERPQWRGRASAIPMNAPRVGLELHRVIE
jgi:hypothetical protein